MMVDYNISPLADRVTLAYQFTISEEKNGPVFTITVFPATP